VYIPLGGNRNGELRTYANLILTFLLGGIWHGAGWTFIFWGLLHGLGLTTHRLWNKLGFRMNKVFAWIITFNFMNITMLIFRAKEPEDAVKVLKGMSGMNGFGGVNSLLTFGGDKINTLFTLVLFCLAWVIIFKKNSNQMASEFTPKISNIIFMALLFSLSILSFNRVTEFLYFNF
jgi:D-alanyl-lipoteichoic acid acyltransferase DltB (MBOAT superfamily)